ncbi:MAG: hypothetical protein Q9217_000113 [Psora testacea]
MAEWRSRGYVPDSDEEDESQGSTNHQTTSANKEKEDRQGVGENGQKGKRIRSVDVGDPGYSHITAVEVRIADGSSFTSSKYARSAVQKSVAQSQKDRVTLGFSMQRSTGKDEIDELQQDHYVSSPAAQLQAELLAEAESDKGTITLNQTAVIESKNTQSQVLPEDDQPQGRGSSNQTTLQATDIQSSPLSDAPSLSDPDRSLNLSDTAGIIRPLCREGSDTELNAQPRSARNLRQRNPIQLHPYAIEGEKYRQILHARGLKALRFAQGDSQRSVEDDTRNQEFQIAGSQSSRASSPRGRYSPGASPGPITDNPQLPEDEFPDMDALLRRQSGSFTTHGYKRRRINKPTFKPPPGLTARKEIPVTEDRMSSIRDAEDIYNVPPSPPISRGSTPPEPDQSIVPTFHIPPELPPRALPTPLPSSEPRRPPQPDLFEANRSDDQSRASTQSGNDSDSQQAPSENEKSHQFQQAQRKIRGVLPASWLKLDLKMQTEKPAKESRGLTIVSSEKRSVRRGLARRVVTLGSQKPIRPVSQQGESDLTDDSDISDEDSRMRDQVSRDLRFVQPEDNNDQSLPASQWEEAMEDNEVDAMLPSSRRNISYPRMRKKRQTRIHDFNVQPNSSVDARQKASRLNKGSEPRVPSIPHHVKTSKPRFRPPKLSILDTPSIAMDTGALSIPKFLQIASRTVRSRQDKGRHDPSRKYLKLATKDDTYDVNQTLRNWQDGNLQPNSSHASDSVSFRYPLLPRSGNARLSRGISKVAGEARSMKQAKSSHEPLATQSRPVNACAIQSSLGSIVRRPSKMPRGPGQRPHLLTEPVNWKDAQKKRTQLVSSLKTPNDSRPALLESLQDDDDRSHPRNAFNRNLSRVKIREARSSKPKPLWERFLGNQWLSNDDERNGTLPAANLRSETGNKMQRLKLRRQRKSCPQRVELSTPFFRQSSSPNPVDELPTLGSQHRSPKALIGRVLTGLGPFGTQYTSTFNITPFPTGTCFHESTFIGSRVFQRSLELSKCDLDKRRASAVYVHGQQTFRWGCWTDTVSSELGNIVEGITQEQLGRWAASKLSALVDLQRQIVNYFSDHLSFLDPIDRGSFLQRWSNLMLLMSLEHCDLHNVHDDSLCQISMNNLVIAHQLSQISNHSSVPSKIRNDLEVLLFSCARRVYKAIKSGFGALTKCLLDFKLGANSALIVRDALPAEALVIARYVVDDYTSSSIGLWELLPTHAPSTFGACPEINVDELEDCWKTLYTVLPYVEFDTQGVLEAGRRFKIASENWAYVRRLISPVLDVYMSNPKGQAPSFNTYCRALFSRCLYLINAWGWRRCDTIIGTLFDFFARNSLNHLAYEESHGSPNFLEHLDSTPSLKMEPEDRCFHLLLKIIGSGIKYMRELYPDKKVRDLVWRLMPNHGRSHPKDEVIRQEDLDALRNHHDLLCTLYWASPPGFRPRLSVIRNLVHLENSHREACHINIRTWSNLVRFQLATHEPTSSLEPFLQWYEDLLQQILRQHSLARTEAQEQVKSIHHAQGLLVSQQLLESTIAENQRQVEAILSDALVCLRKAVQATRTQEAADMMLTPRITTVFSLFDSTKTRTSASIVHTLDVLVAYTEKCSQLARPSISSNDNDDSQDYGDWTAFGDDLLDNGGPQPSYSALRQVHDPLRNLLSNCFGADIPLNDHLLLKIVDVWAAVGQSQVKAGLRIWTDYIGRFGNDAWSSLRETEQTRKYSTYYLARLIEMDTNIYIDHKAFILRCWIESLVERESLLKFQHRLTSVLLDVGQEDILLKNLPFWRSQSSDRYEITAIGFRERRLSLLSSLLSNMRVSIEKLPLDASVNAVSLKQEYKEFLKHLMATMKHNYQELGDCTNVKGAYVDFVHRVIEFLQQHTSSICPVDRFFTENSTFPLPATDPNYVVGQLKNYALRLQDPRAPKELTVFLQSVSERAAIDSQQTYLIDQLYVAMAGCFENGTLRSTLRAFVVEAVIPAYFEMAFQTACGWILALPFLLALRKSFEEVLLDLDGFHIGSVNSVTSIITTFVGSVRGSVLRAPYQPKLLERTSTLKVLRSSYEAITALLPIIDYAMRLEKPIRQAIQDLCFLEEYAADCQAALSGNGSIPPPGLHSTKPELEDQSYADIRSFATGELQQTLEKTWICVDDRYFVARGTSRREVMVDMGSVEAEQEDLRKTLNEFRICLNEMPSIGSLHDIARMKTRPVQGLEDLIF